MRAQQLRYCTVAFLTLVLPLLALGGVAEGKNGPPPPVPWTGPVPKADCGANDRPETGLQGQTSPFERESGLSELGFNCNLELVGQFQGDGAKYMMAWFDDCAYYGTAINPGRLHPGTVVIDASDPRHPRPTAYLDTPAMLDPHESLKVHQKRKLLAAVQEAGPGFAIYDLSADCRHPVLKASIDLADSNELDPSVPPIRVMGHAGNFSPDGRTYYSSQTFRGLGGIMPIIDVSDPANPKQLLNWQFNGDGRPHDLYFNEDGTRGYAMQPGQFGDTGSSVGPNGLVILDLSDIQFRRPNPQIRIISTLFWEDGGQAQMARPVTINGRPYLIATDEQGAGGVGGREGACARGLPPSGFARIIDISDERNPKTVSKLMLEVNDPANCPVVLTDPPANNYSSHYCDVDTARNPKMAACTWRDGGLRVFDIRDPYHPREIAYYKPPARRTAFLPGSELWAPGADRTVDHTPTQIRFVRHKGETELWFTSQDNGFQIVRFTNGVLKGKRKAHGRFDTLPAGADLGLAIRGTAQLTRTRVGTAAKAVVRGLKPSTTYAAHLHNAPCSAADPGGSHYKNDPAGPSAPPNELWLSPTDDPMAGITANRRGVARGRGSADWLARPDAQSIVIHHIAPGGTTAGGPKIACADLE